MSSLKEVRKYKLNLLNYAQTMISNISLAIHLYTKFVKI